MLHGNNADPKPDDLQKIIDTCREDKNCDKNFTLFHKPTKHAIDVKGSHGPGQDVTLHFQGSNKTINFAFKDSKVLSNEDEKADEKPSMESIDEHKWKPVQLDYKKLPDYYLKLAKVRLTGLVVITAQAGYAIAPGAFDPLTFLFCSIGTGLTSAAANSINQVISKISFSGNY